MSEVSASALATRDGCTVRVVRRDGKAAPLTADLKVNRINVEISANRVIAVDSVS